MPEMIVVRDESASGKTLREFALEIPDEQLTARELIRSRVYQEVKDFNGQAAANPQTGFQGLVQPTETELALNGDRTQKKKQSIDWRRQFERAVAAFRANQVLILVDDQQLASLDEEITITPRTRISFLRLTMLKGG